uniref:Uncharacterized protein n=1 Tax=viral metagenome TaxID=1070528 RepID=A0A6C0H5Z7_9ZZZZ
MEQKIQQLTDYFSNPDNLYPFNANPPIYGGYFQFIHKFNDFIFTFGELLIDCIYLNNDNENDKLTDKTELHSVSSDGHLIRISFRYLDKFNICEYLSHLNDINVTIRCFEYNIINHIFKQQLYDNIDQHELDNIRLKTILYFQNNDNINDLNFHLALTSCLKPFKDNISDNTIDNYINYFNIVYILLTKIVIYCHIFSEAIFKLKKCENLIKDIFIKLNRILINHASKYDNTLYNILRTHFNNELFNHENVLDNHENTSNNSENASNNDENVSNNHENVLDNHENVLDNHENVSNNHENVLDNHENVLNNDENVSNNHENALNNSENVLNNSENVSNNDEKELDSDKKELDLDEKEYNESING